VALLNKNIPETSGGISETQKVDSILDQIKSILNEAKRESAAVQRSMYQKEFQIYSTDIELSQKIRGIIGVLENEIIRNAQLDNIRERQALKRGMRFAGGAILAGILVVILFTFLLSRDFWRIQRYRNQLEKEKKYSDSLLKSREQLISTVSHDLRTPLNTISGYTELIGHSGLKKKQLYYLKNVKSAAGYVEKLVNDLLDYSRLEAGQIKLEKVSFDLAHLIRETARNIHDTHGKEGVSLRLRVENSLSQPILNDPFRIRQILSNLIGNAFKFTHAGYVEVSAFPDKKASNPIVVIKIKDTGIGIPKEKQELIFNEFTQAGNGREKTYGGYGLGLTISKKLVTRLGGTLALESQEDKGSTFTLVIPIEYSKVRSEVEGSPKTQLPSDYTLVAIDDDEALLALIKDICSQNNILVQSFTSFNELREAGDFHFDALLTDIQMPIVDGFAVMGKLNGAELPCFKSQPVIAMTGQDIEDEGLYTRAGFTAVLQKPFSSTCLLNVLASVRNAPLPSTAESIQHINIPKSTSRLFSIKYISAFLDKPQAVGAVLEIFLENTAKNMADIQAAVDRQCYDPIRNTVHKMLPMVRQLQAKDLIKTLEKLEHLPDTADIAKVRKMIAQLERAVAQLTAKIREYLLKLPADNG
jgi:signal transduction histidine kinase/CheY-like chemotaxis protein/HPt (histidine-containing phosphotransfer) domain-containing protein